MIRKVPIHGDRFTREGIQGNLATMLPLIVMLSLGLVQDGDRKPTESELRSAHQMLAGDWKIVSATDNGDLIGPELFRRKIAQNGTIRVANRVITHVNPETGETRTTGYMINPAMFPRRIDLITPEERILKGIYKFDDKDLLICYSTREGSTRPADFESQPGSFRILLRLRLGASKPAVKPQADADTPASEGPHATRTRTASLTTPVNTYGARRPSPGELARERDLLGGDWAILSIVDDGESLASNLIRAKIAENGRVRIGVRGMSVVNPRDDQKRLWAYRIDPAPTPKQIDVTTQFDTVLKGIYTFDGDRLRICVAKSEDSARPSSFDASSGTDRMLYTLRMVKDEPALAPARAPAPAQVQAPAPPKPSAEELARRREEQIRQMLVGSWSLTDKKGNLVTVFRPDGSFTATRTLSRRKLFEPDVTTSSGSWSYGGGLLSARVTGTTDRNMLGYGFVGRLQSIGDDSMVTADNSGMLLTLRKLR